MACKIETLKDNNRMSTQELLQTINEKFRRELLNLKLKPADSMILEVQVGQKTVNL